jgi:nucleoid-associated protein EbfC
MFGDLGKMMKMARQMQERAKTVKQELDTKMFTAQAGGGVVAATVNGKLELVELKISPELVKENAADADLLADLVKAAVAAAQTEAAAAAAGMMRELTGGMDIPGLEGLMG